MIRTNTLLAMLLLAGVNTLPQRVQAQAATDSIVASQPAPHATGAAPSWLFPVDKLDESLPEWLHLGGEYRNRLEGPTGIGFTGTRDFYLLDRLRVDATIQPKPWLLFSGEVQDARIFFNHHTPNGNPYEDSWTLWEAYIQVGSSTGWVDVLGGRKVLEFGDERVIGPSEWTNVGRTFNAARADLHHPGYKVSVFAASVVPGENTDLHNALPGNNLYGIYGSFQKLIPKDTFEPYLLWREAPSSSVLPETVGRGHLNEVTIGLHMKGTLPANFDYDTEFDGQTGSLGPSPIRAWAGYSGFGKKFTKLAASPRVFIEGNYASGTKNPAGRDAGNP